MKAITGAASAVVRAGPRRCFSLLASVDRYGAWNGDLIRELEVLERDPDGHPTQVRGVVHVKHSPFAKTFDLTVSVQTEPPKSVHLIRIPNEPSDREELELVWRVGPDGAAPGTRIDVHFIALVSFVPGFVRLGGVGDQLAETLLRSAADSLGGAV